MRNIKILDTVALMVAIPEKKLSEGQVGTVVEKLDKNTYEIEFTNKKGETILCIPIKEKKLMLLHFQTVKI